MKKKLKLFTLIFFSVTFYNLSVVAKEQMKTASHKFPEITGRNLENKEYKLPGDFEGKLNLVFIAFLRKQQSDIDKWLPLAGNLSKKYEHLNYYELPVLNDSYNLVRWFIDGGMKSGIHDKSARERTITVYTNKNKFLTSLDIPEDKAINILLLDSQGKIIWRDQGTFTEEKADNLKLFLERQKN